MDRFTKIISFLIAVSLVFLPMAASAADGTFNSGFSQVTEGMGGSGLALPQDTIIVAINPAGLVFIDHQADLGATLFSPYIAYNATPGVGTLVVAPRQHVSNITLGVIPNVGYQWKVDDKSVMGLALYTLGGSGSAYSQQSTSALIFGNMLPGPYGDGSAKSASYQAIASLTYARKLTSNASAGISLLFAGQTFEATGRSSLSQLTVSSNKGLPVNRLTDNGRNFSSGLGVRASAMAYLFPHLSLAAAYQPEIHMSKLNKYADLIPEGGAFNIPANGVIGLAWEFIQDAFLTFDIQRIWFSDIKAYGNNSSLVVAGACNSSTPENCFGGANGPGLGWKNVTSYKLGAQWKANPLWTLRAGIDHATAPISSSTVVDNVSSPVGVLGNLFGLGFTRLFPSLHSELNGVINYIPRETMSGPNPFSNGTQTIEIQAGGFAAGASWSWLL